MKEKKSASTKNEASVKDQYAQMILDYLARFTKLTKEEEEIILNNIHLKEVKKGTHLLKEGQFAELSFFVFKGCIRQYYLKDGEERTTNFFLEGDTISVSFPSGNPSPSKFYLQSLEDCVLSIGDETVENEMFEQHPKFETICRIATESKLADTNEEMSNFIINSPEERYLNLLETRPELLNRVPQYQLASYLGMKPESLSRIRKRILKR